jgi:O-antigen/teichoic acid export membrane protein
MTKRTLGGYAAAAVTIALGISGLLFPIAVGHLYGLDINPDHPRGWPSLRALFGGVQLALGAMIGYGMLRRADHQELVRFGGYIWGASALGRVVTTVFVQLVSPLNLALVLLDILVATGVLLAGYEGMTPKAKKDTQASTLPTVEGEVVSAGDVSGRSSPGTD